MFFLLFLVLVTLQLLTVLSENLIVCDDNMDADCFGQTLTCPTGDDCQVQCSGFRACEGSTINCPTDESCYVVVSGLSSAQSLTINGGTSSGLTLEISGETGASGSTINCPEYESQFLSTCKVSVWATSGCTSCIINGNDDNTYVFLSADVDGSGGFIGSTINAANADSVKLYSVRPNSYQNVILYCPDDGANKGKCGIQMPSLNAALSLDGAEIFAVEGLNDFGTDGFVSDIDLGEVELYCGVNFDDSCSIVYDYDNLEVDCAPANSACSTIEFTSEPSEEPTAEPLSP